MPCINFFAYYARPFGCRYVHTNHEDREPGLDIQSQSSCVCGVCEIVLDTVGCQQSGQQSLHLLRPTLRQSWQSLWLQSQPRTDTAYLNCSRHTTIRYCFSAAREKLEWHTEHPHRTEFCTFPFDSSCLINKSLGHNYLFRLVRSLRSLPFCGFLVTAYDYDLCAGNL